jgi:hypothetical protein
VRFSHGDQNVQLEIESSLAAVFEPLTVNMAVAAVNEANDVKLPIDSIT